MKRKDFDKALTGLLKTSKKQITMSTNNTNTPLWRELKNKITPGKWEHDGITRIKAGGKIIYENIRVFAPHALEDAQYTSLAVNNFASLAEALTRIRESSLQGLEMYANGEKFSFETLAGFVAEVSGEALTSIS